MEEQKKAGLRREDSNHFNIDESLKGGHFDDSSKESIDFRVFQQYPPFARSLTSQTQYKKTWNRQIAIEQESICTEEDESPNKSP